MDGGTNLKHKKAVKECAAMAREEDELVANFTGAEIECEKENEFLYKFGG